MKIITSFLMAMLLVSTTNSIAQGSEDSTLIPKIKVVSSGNWISGISGNSENPDYYASTKSIHGSYILAVGFYKEQGCRPSIIIHRHSWSRSTDDLTFKWEVVAYLQNSATVRLNALASLIKGTRDELVLVRPYEQPKNFEIVLSAIKSDNKIRIGFITHLSHLIPLINPTLNAVVSDAEYSLIGSTSAIDRAKGLCESA